jgi:cytochrome c oxidase subunit 4
MADHAHQVGHAHGHRHEHGFGHGEMGHIVPKRVLLTVFGVLLVLTIVTVAVTHVDLGKSWNLFVAMTIAAVKASLVCLYFMHLRYDKLMHSIMIITALLFFTLFVGFALMDRSQYEDSVRWNQNKPTHPAPF